MARLAVTSILLTVIVGALCGVLDAEPAASPYPSEQADGPYYAAESVTVPAADGAYYDVDAFAVPVPDGAADEAVQSYSLPASSAKVPPVEEDNQGFLRLHSHRRHRHPCRHGHRHLWWARRHGLLRQDVHGFNRHRDVLQAQENHVAELPAEPAYGEEAREVVLPVAEPDPDSRSDAAVAAEAIQVPAFHTEQEDDDAMGKAWKSFRRFHHHHRHHHQNKHEEEDEHELAEEVAPVKRSRSHHHHDAEEPETRTKRFHHDDDHDNDDEDELEEEMAERWIRKALARSRFHHHGRRFHRHHLHLGHRAEDAAGEEEKGGVMGWLKDLVNRF